jgi:hypothetical protein
MMTISKLTTLAQERSGIELDRYSMESVKWFTSKIRNLRNPANLSLQIKKETSRNTQRFLMGGLYFFYYNAKTSDKLDYWDAFPLVIPLERYNDGFLGINLHYLPLRYRAIFMDKLMNFALYDDNDEIKRLRVTYDIISASKRYKEFKPCLKRYLYSNIASKLLKVQANEWETAVFLPVHQFQKERAPKVWKESVDEIKGKQAV